MGLRHSHWQVEIVSSTNHGVYCRYGGDYIRDQPHAGVQLVLLPSQHRLARPFTEHGSIHVCLGIHIPRVHAVRAGKVNRQKRHIRAGHPVCTTPRRKTPFGNAFLYPQRLRLRLYSVQNQVLSAFFHHSFWYIYNDDYLHPLSDIAKKYIVVVREIALIRPV